MSERETIEVDYLIVGAGAMGLAFADTLLAETDATVAIVDRYGRPGGHWTVAYPFVRLHQPSSFYGVNSRELGTDDVDQDGWNAGLHELASSDEILTYFDQVMRKTFLPSGRISYFPMSHYDGADPARPDVQRCHSLVTGGEFDIRVRRRTVDATYMNVTVPAMCPPKYEVASGVRLITPNQLPALDQQASHYTVVGAGKTGIDACLWLLQHGVDPSGITWIMPRDSWLLDRAQIQPGPENAASDAESFTARIRAVLESRTVEELFQRLEAAWSPAEAVVRRHADGVSLRDRQPDRTRTAPADHRHRPPRQGPAHRCRRGGTRRGDRPRPPRNPLHRLHRGRPGGAAGGADVQWLPHHVAGARPVPAGIQRRLRRPRRGNI